MSNQRLVFVPLCLSLLPALYIGAQRVSLERGNTAVALLVDEAEIEALAAFSHKSIHECRAALKGAGLTGVTVEEPSFAELAEQGLVRAAQDVPATRWWLGTGTPQGHEALQALYRDLGLRVARVDPDGMEVEAPWSAIAGLGAGLDPERMQAVREAGLAPVARLRNGPGMSAKAVDAALHRAKEMGARMVLFGGDQVLGFRDVLGSTAEALREADLTWCRVEFAVQKGELGLAERLLAGPRPTSYLRVHSITAAEMPRLTPDTMLDRYRRAAQERGIRVLFIRLLLTANDQPLETNVAHLQALAEQLRRAGLHPGEPAPLHWPGGPRWAVLTVVWLGVAPAAAWLLVLLCGGWQPGRWLAWWLGLALLLSAALLVKPGLGAKLGALAAGIAYPTLAGRWAWLRLSEQPPRSRWAAVWVLWQAAGWAVLGGLLVQAQLASARYMLGHDIFSGVKLTQVLPLGAMLALVGLGLAQPGVDAATVRERWRGFWGSPVRFQHAVVLVAGLAAVAVLLMRSGNEAANVPEAELRFRALLETLLGARPRTKEFLCGDPALLLAALAAWRGRREWVGPLLVVGMIGLASTLNTFCHIHTPLSQSLLRTFHALWLATLLGLAADAWLHRRARPETAGG